MKKYFLIKLLAVFPIFISAQDVWGGVSVATPDNLDAVSNNPAGLGLQRNVQSGTYIPFDSVFTTYSSFRTDGFGYDLRYDFPDGEFPELFNPADGNIGIGFSIDHNAYAGIKWNKDKLLDIGLLYRPLNFLSLGLVSQFNDEFSEYNTTTLGLALRPIFSHRLTVGADFQLDKENNQSIFPHIHLQVVDGISLTGRSNEDFDDFKVSLGFNFGKEVVYSSSHINTDSELKSGIGFYSVKQKQKTIFNKLKKQHQQFIRLKLDGKFIEENPVKPPFSLDINPFVQRPKPGIQLRRWIEEIDGFTENPDIHGIIIDIGSVSAGFAKRGEIYAALTRFKDAGKSIIVYADKGIGNADYYLISMADEIYLNEYTGVDLRGLKMELSFFKGLLDTLSIVPEVFRVNVDGKSYKTAADQFLYKKMSDEMKENYGDLLNDFYDIFLNGISTGRDWTDSKTEETINNGPYFTPQSAIEAGLADSVMYPDQFDEYLKSLNEEKVTITKWNDIDRSEDYVHDWAPPEKEKIALIYAVGGIRSGKSNPGPAGSSIMGDETISKAIKTAREDKNIKAVVFRINSGGGSALASDMMWREVLKTTDPTAGDSANVKPFIATMSDVAGSGGYYIACQADTIVASPGTVTGSIGVIGLRLNFSKLLNKFGITSDLIKKGDFADFGSGNRLISEEEEAKVQASINNVYDRFKEKVRAGRDSSYISEDMDEVAMGRIFSGKRAKDGIVIPLVDVVGGLQDAIDLAKAAAGLEDQEVDIIEFPRPADKFKEIAKQFTASSPGDIRHLLPEKLADEFDIIDVIPILLDDETLMMIPVQISIN
ncbi:MAG: signal peptide peptidase SppA [Candidatus Marinimicrobia bacterium]|nr:signal peptide peptidase SppA [Candidatus Neomarinimicrobiota bacterium]